MAFDLISSWGSLCSLESNDLDTAAKAAISHIELLVKLAKWADLPDEKDGSPDLALMIANAQQELDKNGGGVDG